MQALTRALASPDDRVVAIARAALVDLKDQAAIDAVCGVWLASRTAALDALLTEQGWVASQPAALLVATALHNGHREVLADGDPEVARALIAAVEQEQPALCQRAQEALAALRRAESREAVCSLALENGNPTALETALNGNFTTDPGRRAVLLFLAGEFDRYADLDYDGSLLRAAHQVAGAQLRRRLAKKARAAGRVEWVRALTGGHRKRQLGELSDVEWKAVVSVLVTAGRWEELWHLALEAPAVWSARMLRKLGQRGFTPAEEQERADCAALIELAGESIAEPVLVLEGHENEVSCLVAIPDGGLLASGSADTTVRLWRLPSGEPAGILKGHPFPVSCLAASPCGTLLASGCSEGTARLWQLPSGSRIGKLDDSSGSHFSCLAVTPNGRKLIGGTACSVVKRDTGRTEAVAVGTGYTQGAPDGYFYTIYEHRPVWEYQTTRKLQLWKLPSGKSADTLSIDGQVKCLALTPDGRLLAGAVSERSETKVQLWRLPSGERVGTLKCHTGKISRLAVTPDGALLAGGSSDGTIQLWQLPSRELDRTLKGHTGEISCLAISPDGRFLASGSRNEKRVRIWRLPSGEPAHSLDGHKHGILSLTFSPDGAILASGGGDGKIRLWSWLGRKPLDEIDLAEIELMRQSAGERPAAERAWIELIAALVRRRHRHDIEFVERPCTVGEWDIELDS